MQPTPGSGTTVMLIGNTGVGKSSLGCRLLGQRAAGKGCDRSKLAFQVGDSCSSVTGSVSAQTGPFSGTGSPWTVVDTPGLGDSRGGDEDTKHMAAIGNYLNSVPVNAIAFVLSANPRIDYTLKRLINIIVTKVHPSDFDKLCIVLNQWSHSDYWREERERVSGLTEDENQERRKSLILDALEGYVEDGLKLTSYQIQGFSSRIFFLDSIYTDFSLRDKECFDHFGLWCDTNHVINQETLSKDTGDVYVELKYAEDEIKSLQAQTAQEQRKHLQELNRLEIKAAQERAHAEEAEQLADKIAAVKLAALQKELEAAKEKDRIEHEQKIKEHNMEQDRKKREHAKKLAELDKARQAEKKHHEQISALHAQTRDAKRREAEEKKKELEAKAEAQRIIDERNKKKKCFPGAALVQEQTRGCIPMSSLHAGDKVLSIDKTGSPLYDQVMFFGHREAALWSCFQVLTMQRANSAAMHHLCLTPTHFVPTGAKFGSLTYKHAQSVIVGETLWVQDMETFVPATVTRVGLTRLQGIFNPFTKGGLIVVDGVVASVHSHWLLDDLVPSAALPLLPHVYQLTFAPVFSMGTIIGVQRLSNVLDQYVVPHLHEWPGLGLFRHLKGTWNKLLSGPEGVLLT